MSLTKREKEVASYMLKGMSNKEMAEKLFVSKPTIAFHIASILKKTNFKTKGKFMANYYIEKVNRLEKAVESLSYS